MANTTMQSFLRICRKYKYDGDIPELVEKIYKTAPEEYKAGKDKELVILQYADKYFKANGYTPVTYDALVIGQDYSLEVTPTCITIDKDISNFHDNRPMYVINDNGYKIPIGKVMAPHNDRKYTLVEKDPDLVFKGELINKAEEHGLSWIRSRITDLEELDKYLNANEGKTIKQQDLYLFHAWWSWYMERDSGLCLRERFNDELAYHGWNGNPSMDMYLKRGYIITLLHNSSEMVAFVDLLDNGRDLDLHLSDEGFTVMAGDKSLSQVYDEFVYRGIMSWKK